MIYAIGNRVEQVYKIGFTRDRATAKKRLSALRVSSHFRLDLLALAEGTTHEEHALHILLKEFNTSGEWFHDSRNPSDMWDDDVVGNVVWLLATYPASFVLGHDRKTLGRFYILDKDAPKLHRI